MNPRIIVLNNLSDRLQSHRVLIWFVRMNKMQRFLILRIAVRSREVDGHREVQLGTVEFA